MSSRAELAHQMNPGLQGNSPKTFVLEVHNVSSVDCVLQGLWGAAALQETADAHLRVVSPTNGPEFWVDSLGGRFWRFHTLGSASAAHRVLKDAVESHRWLDWPWLPTGQLRQVWPGAPIRQVSTSFDASDFSGSSMSASRLRLRASGPDAGELLDELGAMKSFSRSISLSGVQVRAHDVASGDDVDEAVTRDGRFIAAGGSFEFHEAIVSGVIARYEALISAIESRLLRWHPIDGGGGILAGTPITILLSEPVSDPSRLIDGIFNSRAPFRLWGTYEQGDATVTVDAVDLHVGQALAFQFTPDSVSVIATAGTCGNTVARIVSNLQHSFDANVRFAEEELQAALATSDLIAAQ